MGIPNALSVVALLRTVVKGNLLRPRVMLLLLIPKGKGVMRVSRLYIIMILTLSIGVMFWLNKGEPRVSNVSKLKENHNTSFALLTSPDNWKFVHCTPTNIECGRLE